MCFWTVFWGQYWEKVLDWGIGRFWDKLDVLDVLDNWDDFDELDVLEKLDENWVTG